MANRIGFKEFLKKLEKDSAVQLIVDANVIIASRDKSHRDYNTVRDFFTELYLITKNVTLFTTVTTKSEFLEYYRRKILTEAILGIYKRNKEEQIISDDASRQIERQIRARNQRQNREVEKQEKIEKVLEARNWDTTNIDIEEFSIDANYFKDSEIKEIKKSFRGRDVANETGWVNFCNLTLVEKLHQFEKLLDGICHYLTTRDDEARKFFTKTDVEWRLATQICGETGMGYSDAMILNMANHTSIKHIMTLDFDMVYGGHVSAKSKTIVTPTDRLKNYKNALKGV